MSVEIIGPFKQRDLVINGWSVPMMSAAELDGGKFSLVIDHRLGVTVDAEHFDRVATFVADVIATCFGYGAHPRDEDFDYARFARVPHFVLQPSRVREITAVGGDEEDAA